MISVILLTAGMALPIRPCDTDSDCQAAAAAIGCHEVSDPRKPRVLFVCDRAKYLKALEAAR